MKKLIISLVLLFAPMIAFASIDTNLYYGIQNKPAVQELQEFLIDKGFHIDIYYNPPDIMLWIGSVNEPIPNNWWITLD